MLARAQCAFGAYLTPGLPFPIAPAFGAMPETPILLWSAFRPPAAPGNSAFAASGANANAEAPAAAKSDLRSHVTDGMLKAYAEAESARTEQTLNIDGRGGGGGSAIICARDPRSD